MSWARAKKADLVDEYLKLTGQADSDVQNHPSTKALLIEALEKLWRENREERHRQAKMPKVHASLCTITAREVNEWLRALPITQPN